MTETFTASNGVRVRISANPHSGQQCIYTQQREHTFAYEPTRTDALREYFRDERDERDQETPYSVVEGAFTIARFFERELAEDFVRKMGHGYMVIRPEEKKPHPWEDSPAGSVWKIVSGGCGRHALIWRSHVGDWDVLGPKGESLKEADDPVAALVEAGYPEFEEYKSAVEMKES